MMNEYVFEDLIMNPETPNLERLIGKEVYYSNTPLYCLNNARYNCKTGILKEIQKDGNLPFWVDNRDGAIVSYACILPKKEEPKPKYVSFESPQEFISAYNKASKEVTQDTESMLLNSGMWLKWQDHYVGITYISKKGVNYGVEFLDWDELLDEYTFLDGSPVGKEVNGEVTPYEYKKQDELSIGTRFHYEGKLVEVVEGDQCVDCVFAEIDCSQKRCVSEERSDKKNVYFKEVKGE